MTRRGDRIDSKKRELAHERDLGQSRETYGTRTSRTATEKRLIDKGGRKKG